MKFKAISKISKAGISVSRFIAIIEDINTYNYKSIYNRIDVIIGSLIFHDLSIDERDKFFKEAYKILTKGGCIIIGDYVGEELPAYKKKFLKNWAKDLSMSRTPDQIKDFFKQPEIIEMLNAETIKSHIKSLKSEGFKTEVGTYWKYGNYAVIVASKE